MAYILILLIITPFSVVLDGFAFQQLWNWFIVPFIGFPSLSLVAALGIATTISYVTHKPTQISNEGKTLLEIFSSAAYLITKPLAALLFGWIIMLFM